MDILKERGLKKQTRKYDTYVSTLERHSETPMFTIQALVNMSFTFHMPCSIPEVSDSSLRERRLPCGIRFSKASVAYAGFVAQHK